MSAVAPDEQRTGDGIQLECLQPRIMELIAPVDAIDCALNFHSFCKDNLQGSAHPL
jgi:hypothetical protein